MAQAPATPKLRRWLIRAAARLGLAGRMHLQPSERAALALRAAGPLPRPKRVVFLLPLVGPRDVGDWSVVEARLADTLRSFLNQSDPRWQAVICCQRRPALPDDPRIVHQPFDDPAPGNDKWRKLAALCAGLHDLGPDPGFVMSFDSDDLLHPDAVATMLADETAPGWLAGWGFVLDHGSGQLGLAGPPTPTQPRRKPFWKLCGSCLALRWDPARAESATFLAAMTAHEHRMFPHLARLAGLRPRPMPAPWVLYMINHGENFGARRGRTGFKTRFVRRYAISDAAAAEARREFGIWRTDGVVARDPRPNSPAQPPSR